MLEQVYFRDMVSIKAFTDIASSFPETIEQPHFGKISFRVNKKIFATLDTEAKQVCIKLTEIQQDVFCGIDASIIYPVPNKWGKQGWTFIDLRAISRDILKDALVTAYCSIAPKRLSVLVQKDIME